MRTRSKVIIGLLVLVAAGIGFGAWNWFNRPPRPIIVAEAGWGGERVILGTAPANFYPGAGDGPRPAILLLGGSEGGLKDYRNAYARQLAAEGYAVIYPGYFETREANRSFENVPLETFDEALAWLAARPDVDPERIAVIGHSKGSEGALLVASRHPEVKAVVAAMPSDVVWQGFDFNRTDVEAMGSSWTAEGKPLPFVRYVVPAWHEWITQGQGALARMYRNSWQARAAYPGATIPVERIKGPILLICGGQDQVWPSCDMARAAEARAPDARLLKYDSAGHWAFGPTQNLTTRDRKMLGKLGGTPEADMAARRDQWQKIRAFLDQALD
ncbi:alpha/beta fold hydrolase [Altererythrobacter sp. H2]|uniref:alpha/beta fold hydrolase n=1 Tax=Altererythrobacter sp. H2 TaxID=3108391 RepID=UPI002B4BCE88|nr:alpha/beta fold hydrolase [Altererythrobacter sp. H2]WRK94541.1 alpha/beta fold hydrolase [Altererythrobacter sp. H2]